MDFPALLQLMDDECIDKFYLSHLKRALGITNKGINLTTFLCTFGSE